VVQEVIKQFERVNICYEELITISENIFLLLKQRKFQALDIANREEINGVVKLQTELESLKEKVIKACEQRGDRTNKLSSLLPLLNAEERGKLLACQTTAFNYEKKLKNNTKMNQCLVEAMMNSSQTIVDTWVHIAKEEKQNNSFVNKKL
jgi:hypothetical protein